MFYEYFVFLLCCWKCWYVAHGAGKRNQVDRTPVQCRDNNNRSVDWWYIYKPPSAPYMEEGLNFSYISADSVGRWQTSDRYISSGSMLEYTLAPLYTPRSKVAYVKFEAHTEFSTESTSNGILMADKVGGLYLGHDIPKYPNIDKKPHQFPMSEGHVGRLLVCISVTLSILHELAVSIKQSGAKFTQIKRPDQILIRLRDWKDSPKRVPSVLDFVTKFKTVHAQLWVRRPGDRYCLYKLFARQKGIILDVYGQNKGSFCQDNYGVRSIDTISLKYSLNDIDEDGYDIQYINHKKDNAKFAVSTAAHYQKKGSGPVQFWSCVGTLDSSDLSERGGILLCLDSLEIWASFNNLKGSDPVCHPRISGPTLHLEKIKIR